MIHLALIIFAYVTAFSQAMPARTLAISPYEDRPLNLPKVEPYEVCPVSVGARGIVSASHPYIFGAGGYWYGTGPIYLGLSWKEVDRPDGVFVLDKRTHMADGYRLKTPWIMRPDYDGEALVRGARITINPNERISFRGPEPDGPNMVLKASQRPSIQDSDRSGFWPSHMVVPGPGCYAVQIDTKGKTDIVVFEATSK